jgi:putative heme iron utilization protein
MPASLSTEQVNEAWIELVQDIRIGVLLTLRDGRPFGSHVPFVVGNDWTRLYIHISRLALHTRHLLADPSIGMFISEPDRPEKNPLALKRCTLQGEGHLLSSDHADHAQMKARYLERFPQSARVFGFSDFQMWELRMESAHFVLAFGHAYLAYAADPSTWVHQKPDGPTKT